MSRIESIDDITSKHEFVMPTDPPYKNRKVKFVDLTNHIDMP